MDCPCLLIPCGRISYASIYSVKVKTSKAAAISKIAHYDFPEQYPNLLPSLISLLASPTTLPGALRVLSDITLDLSDTFFPLVAKELYPILLSLASNGALEERSRARAMNIWKNLMDVLYMLSEEYPPALAEYLDPVLGQWLSLFHSVLESPNEGYHLKQVSVDVRSDHLI